MKSRAPKYYKVRHSGDILIMSASEIDELHEMGFKVKVIRKATEAERKDAK